MKTLSILTLITLIACCLVACETKVKSQKEIRTENGYNVVTIDSCEYIEIKNGKGWANNYSYTLTHKGTCKNKIHNGK
jgi:hypothetical protein